MTDDRIRPAARAGFAPNWRLSLDDAWRSASLRRRFEDESGLSPLAVTARDVEEQTARGHTARYHEAFLLWATKYLGLEDVAPPFIREKLTTKSRNQARRTRIW
jgi:hypothetical protein